MANFCPACGKPNAEQVKYCTSCGKPIADLYAAPRTSLPTGKPNNYLIPAILVTLFCCWPFGIVSIVYAAQVDGKWHSGDQQGAFAAARNAKTWLIVSLSLGLIIIAGYLILIVGAALTGTLVEK